MGTIILRKLDKAIKGYDEQATAQWANTAAENKIDSRVAFDALAATIPLPPARLACRKLFARWGR